MFDCDRVSKASFDTLSSRLSSLLLLSEQEETKASIASLRRLRSELVRWQKLHPEPPPQLQAVERDVQKLLKQVEAAMKKMKTNAP